MAKKDKKKEKTRLESTTDKVGEVAIHYGFTVIKPPQISLGDHSELKHFKSNDRYEDAIEKIALTRWYIEEKLDQESQPIAIHFKKPFLGNNIKKKTTNETYGLEIMGSSRSTSEALLLKCVIAILEELGYKDLCIDINSIGDRDSMAKFERELGSYYRKNAQDLSAKSRQEFKKNPHSLLSLDSEENKDLKHPAPEPISSLSEIARLHFKEILENVETFNVVYKIKSNLLSNKSYASFTVFEIRAMPEENKEVKKTEGKKEEDGTLLAYGYRYNHLAKKLGAKREIPSVGATILVKKNQKMMKKVIIKNIKKPKFYLVQLGSTAKLKALNVVEILRKNKIPVYHSITKDKITGQLTGAEYMKATHVLIMGQKEAVENSMVVRDIISREQETVPLSELPEFLKNLGKGKK